MISFGSDNHAGVHPAVLEALALANVGTATAYGGDAWTTRFREAVKREFGGGAVAYPVFNGTGANLIALGSMLKRYEAVIAVAKAHIDTDEAGAPERVGGFKLLTYASPDQKLTPAQIREGLYRRGDPHAVQPRVVSITQTTEMGTLYSLAEIRALSHLAHAEGLFLHMDGARVANAAAALGCSLRAATTDLGVDVLSFGGTKNGAMGAEAVIGLSPEYVARFGEDLHYGHKQGLHLASKMRFVSAQLTALLTDDLWRTNALHANTMAKLLEAEASRGGAEITQSVSANAVFARLPVAVVTELQKKYVFHIWDEADLAQGKVIVRWMTSFSTAEADVLAFAADIRSTLG